MLWWCWLACAQTAQTAATSPSLLRPPSKQVKHVLKHSSSWQGGLCIFILIITLVMVLLLAAKLGR